VPAIVLYKPEQIIVNTRQIESLTAQSKPLAAAS
jgi:hypothetical protein